MVSKRKGDLAWIEPESDPSGVQLVVRSKQVSGGPPPAPKIGRGGSFNCLRCRQTIHEDDIKALGMAGKLGIRMTAVVADTGAGRIYREPTLAESVAAVSADIGDIVDLPLGDANQYLAPPRYGIDSFLGLFTARQALTIDVLAEEVASTLDEIISDGGTREYASTVVTMLALAVGKRAQYGSTLSSWKLDSRSGTGKAERAFPRADIPMTWDFAQAAPFPTAPAVGFSVCGPCSMLWVWFQRAQARLSLATRVPQHSIIEASWRRTLRTSMRSRTPIYPTSFICGTGAHCGTFMPDLYHTVAAPKTGELTAFAWHHGGTKEAARQYFIEGFTETFETFQTHQLEGVPMLVVYASKEQKAGRDEEGRWSSILSSMIAADMEITATWPIHGTGSTRLRGIGANAVATYIVMVCYPRPSSSSTCSLADFNRALRRELGPAVRDLQAASILPVDLAQAAMGPGMKIFSRYRGVLDQSGKRLGIDQALRLINSALAEVLDEQEGELDPESRFAVRWWETYGWAAASLVKRTRRLGRLASAWTTWCVLK